jgi:polyphosphate kinase
VFWFSGGKEDPEEGDFLIGSADWMYRNLQTRVEAATPIQHPAHRRRLWSLLQACLDDARLAWQMQPDGSYVQVDGAGVPEGDPRLLGLHQRLMDETLAR